MPYRLMADLVVIFHFCVVIFVVGGGLLVVRWKKMAWLHLPVIAWVIFAEVFHHLCPLTYLENWLRSRGGIDSYRGDFVAHYIMPVLYPNGLTERMQVFFGVSILLINLALYSVAFYPRKPRGSSKPAPI